MTVGLSDDRRQAELEDARDLMLVAAAVIERWQRRLEGVAEKLPTRVSSPRPTRP